MVSRKLSLWAAIAIWVALAAATLMAEAWLVSLDPGAIGLTILVALLGAPAILAYWACRRDWRGKLPWLPIPVIAGCTAALFYAANPLILAGAQARFLLERDRYERVVHDLRRSGASGRREGSYDGVRYTVYSSQPAEIAFHWTPPDKLAVIGGVIYDEEGCPPNLRPLPQPPPTHESSGDGADLPTLKLNGRISRPGQRLSGHYCLLVAVW